MSSKQLNTAVLVDGKYEHAVVGRYSVGTDKNKSPVLLLTINSKFASADEDGNITVPLSLFNITVMMESMDKLLYGECAPSTVYLPTVVTDYFEPEDMHNMLYGLAYADGTAVTKAIAEKAVMFVDKSLDDKKIITYHDVLLHITDIVERALDQREKQIRT